MSNFSLKFRGCSNTQNTTLVTALFSPDQPVLNFYSTATRSQRQRPKSRLRRCTLSRPVYESSFRTSKDVYETSRNRSSWQRRWSSFIVAKPADSGVPIGILIAGVSAIFLESCTKFSGRDPSTKPQPTGGLHPQPGKPFVVRFVKLWRVVAGIWTRCG